jgi:hypothetical protein
VLVFVEIVKVIGVKPSEEDGSAVSTSAAPSAA